MKALGNIVLTALVSATIACAIMAILVTVGL